MSYEPKRSPGPTGQRRANLIAVLFMAVFLGLLLLGAVLLNRGGAASATVGDCVALTGSESIKVVSCDDGDADFKVVGRIAEKTEIEATISECVPFPDADHVYWQGKSGMRGVVLCLTTVS